MIFDREALGVPVTARMEERAGLLFVLLPPFKLITLESTLGIELLAAAALEVFFVLKVVVVF